MDARECVTVDVGTTRVCRPTSDTLHRDTIPYLSVAPHASSLIQGPSMYRCGWSSLRD
jgi:hypothetical protein